MIILKTYTLYPGVYPIFPLYLTLFRDLTTIIPISVIDYISKFLEEHTKGYFHL